ncbi:MAG TPA: hypothetical protein HA257_01545 [Candidatus Methanoperedenaceae archaeon]|nr:hypothetical protein [Candidatus Methanoperedenaceae archaeon]
MELVSIVCRRCEFFREDDIELECAALKVLAKLEKSGKVSIDDIREAAKEV